MIFKVGVPSFEAVVPLKPLPKLLWFYLTVLRVTGAPVWPDVAEIGDQKSSRFFKNVRFRLPALVLLLGHFVLTCWQFVRLFLQQLNPPDDPDDAGLGSIYFCLDIVKILGVFLSVAVALGVLFHPRSLAEFCTLWSELRLNESDVHQIELFAKKRMRLYLSFVVIVHLASVSANFLSAVASDPSWMLLLDSLQSLIGDLYLFFFVFISDLLSEVFRVLRTQLTSGQDDRSLTGFFAAAEMVKLFDKAFSFALGFQISIILICHYLAVMETLNAGYQGGAMRLVGLFYQFVLLRMLTSIPVKVNEQANKLFPVACKLCVQDIPTNLQNKYLTFQNYLSNSPVGFTLFRFYPVNESITVTIIGVYATVILMDLWETLTDDDFWASSADL